MVAQRRPSQAARRVRGEGEIEGLSGDAIELEQRIAASPATVFSYLTESAKFVLWMGARAQLDPSAGGGFRIDVDGVNIAAGEYREVDPPRRVVMSWGWEGSSAVPPGSTTVEITLEPVAGGTLLRLRHIGLPGDPERDSHRQGWIQYTGKLATLF